MCYAPERHHSSGTDQQLLTSNKLALPSRALKHCDPSTMYAPLAWSFIRSSMLWPPGGYRSPSSMAHTPTGGGKVQ